MAVNSQDQQLQDNDKYQYFMSNEDLVRIEIHQDPKGHFVYWRDVQDCFKGLIRVQDGPTYIPMMRDENGYRRKPHRIRHVPGRVLQVVYGEATQEQKKTVRPPRTGSKAKTIAMEITPTGSSVAIVDATPTSNDTPNNDQDSTDGQRSNTHSSETKADRKKYVIGLEEVMRALSNHAVRSSGDSESSDPTPPSSRTTNTVATEDPKKDNSNTQSDPSTPLSTDPKDKLPAPYVALYHSSKEMLKDLEQARKMDECHKEMQRFETLHREALERKKFILAGTLVIMAKALTANLAKVAQDNKVGIAMRLIRDQMMEADQAMTRERSRFIKKRLSRFLAMDDVHVMIHQAMDERIAGVAPAPDTQDIPFLFVILYESRGVPTAAKASREYRVHFLCDRRVEIQSEDDVPVERWIHIGDHPGYPIKDMDQFLKLFGSHVYGCLELLQYGLTIDGTTAPPMEGADDRWYVEKALASLEEWADGSDIFEAVTEFEMLKSRIARDFAKVVDISSDATATGGELCGGLHRAVDPSGYGIMVCKEHYEAMGDVGYLGDGAFDDLAWVDPEDGYFQPSKGWLTLTCRTPEKTRDYFSRIVEVQPRVITLELTLPWNVTNADLYFLEAMLDDANIVNLILSCPQHPSPKDGFLGGDKMDPLFDIMAGRRLPGFVLVDDQAEQTVEGGSASGSKRIRPRAMKLTCNLRNRDDSEYLVNLLKDVPKVTDLLVVIEGEGSAGAFFKKLPQSFLKRITNLVLEDGDEDQAVFKLAKGKVASVDLEVEHWLESDFLDQPALKTLKILQPLDVASDAVPLVKTIMTKKSLKSLHFVSEARDFAGMTACLLEPMVKHPALESIMISDIRMSHLQLEHEKGTFPGTFISLQSSEVSTDLVGALRAMSTVLNAIDFPKIENDQVAALLEGIGKSQTTSLYMVDIGIARLNHKGRSDLAKLINKSPIGVEDVEAGCAITFESHPRPRRFNFGFKSPMPLAVNVPSPSSATTTVATTTTTTTTTPKELADFIRSISSRLTKLVLKVSNLEEIVRAMRNVLWTEMRDFCSFQIIGCEMPPESGDSSKASTSATSATSTAPGPTPTSTSASTKGTSKPGDSTRSLYLTLEGGGKTLVNLMCMVGPLMTIGLQNFHMDMSLWKVLFKKMTFGGLRTLKIHDLEYSNKELLQALVECVQDRKVFALEEIGLRAPFLPSGAISSLDEEHVAKAAMAVVGGGGGVGGASGGGQEDVYAHFDEEFGLDKQLRNQLFKKFKKQITIKRI
ncbi:hypothetical protein BGZ74_001032 [Mortierella antarctica]|nr:hypothetical protein BGZ74_001032 [Mortierella antarctica]